MTLACQAIVPGGGDICRAMCGFGGGMTCWLPRYLPQGDGLAPPGRLRTQWKVGAGAGGGQGVQPCTPHLPRVSQPGKGGAERAGKEGRGEPGWGGPAEGGGEGSER